MAIFEFVERSGGLRLDAVFEAATCRPQPIIVGEPAVSSFREPAFAPSQENSEAYTRVTILPLDVYANSRLSQTWRH